MTESGKVKKRLKRPITTKQAKYFKLLCQGVPATQAALKAGYTSKNPAQAGYAASKSIRARIQKGLFEAGLTPEGLIHKHLVPALKAKETKFFQHEGMVTDSRDVVAWDIRLRAQQFAAKLGGYEAPTERSDTNLNALTETLIINTSAIPRHSPRHA